MMLMLSGVASLLLVVVIGALVGWLLERTLPK